MKTKSYNPSPLEVELAKAISNLKTEISKLIPSNKIVKIENIIERDNPQVLIHMVDDDGDPHEIVLKIIQKPDKF